jgi:hypothetical protein
MNQLNGQPSLVVTSIAAPNRALRSLAAGAVENSFRFYVIGDVSSPAVFELEGCQFYNLAAQTSAGLRFAELCPIRHYARKNIGYLLAMRGHSSVIVETDDDNLPRREFWAPRSREQTAPAAFRAGWLNVYAYFSESAIWPRGLPLDAVQTAPPPYCGLPVRTMNCPIQQGLADGDPDVDAICRLTSPLPRSFRLDRSVILGEGTYSPFNSQNTTWWPEAYPLLYLPAYCSFRMTDIWRSFVAQRIAHENGWAIFYHAPTLVQERNDHALLRDFEDEIPGYLHNRAIMDALAALTLMSGTEYMADNLRRCYETLVRNKWVGVQELQLLEAWLADLEDGKVDR